MTEDPLKLFVVVMAVLLCVLAVVAVTAYDTADSYRTALDRAQSDAKEFSELASSVKKILDRVSKGELKGGYLPFIQTQERRHNISHSKFGKEPRPKSVGPRLEEHRFFVDFYRTRATKPLRRDQIARFCRDVERNSRGLLKTLEIRLTRVGTGAGAIPPGREDQVRDDTYTGRVVFGFRTAK